MTGIFPNQLAHVVDGPVTISKNTPSGTGPLSILFVPAAVHNNFIGRYKVYQGAGQTVLAKLVADGFSSTSSTYLVTQAMFSQVPTPFRVVIGKREVGDISWSATLQAIVDAVPNGEVPPFFCIKIETKDKADLIDASQWALSIQSSLINGPNFWLSLETADPAVLTAQNGNVIQTIALQSAGNLSSNGVASIAWSDMTRVQIPAQLQTKLETFDLTPPFDIPLYAAWKVNNGPLQYFFFDGAPALVQGTGPFPANLEPGNNLDMEIDGFAISAVFDAAAATLLSGAQEPYAPAGGEDFTILFEGVPHLITLLITDTTAALIATNINTVVGSVVASDSGGRVLLTSTVRGTDSLIQVQEGTGGNAILQFSTTPVSGTGNVGDIDAVTLTEAIDVIQDAAMTNGLIYGDVELNIESTTYGTGSTVEILNTSAANLLTELGLSVGVTSGSGFANNLAATTAVELAALYTSSLTAVVHDSSTARVISSTVDKGQGTSIRLALPQVQVLTLTSNAADDIGFTYDNLAPLTVVSVDEATDAAALKALFDADLNYTAIGALEVGFDNTLRFIALDNGVHTFADQSTGSASIAVANSSVSYTALGYTDLIAFGSGIAEAYLDAVLPARYLSYSDPNIERKQRPTDRIVFNPAPPALNAIRHSGIKRDEMLTVVNGDGSDTYGGWVLDATSGSCTLGTQMANKTKIQTFITAVLFKNAVVRDTNQFLQVNAQQGNFIGSDELAFNNLVSLYLSIINQFVIAGHITAYKDPSDQSFDPQRDSTLIVLPFAQQSPADLQQGIFRGFQFNLVAKSPLQRIFFEINIDGAFQTNLT